MDQNRDQRGPSCRNLKRKWGSGQLRGIRGERATVWGWHMGLTQIQRGVVMNCDIPLSWDKQGYFHCSCQWFNTYAGPSPHHLVVHTSAQSRLCIRNIKCIYYVRSALDWSQNWILCLRKTLCVDSDLPHSESQKRRAEIQKIRVSSYFCKYLITFTGKKRLNKWKYFGFYVLLD